MVGYFFVLMFACRSEKPQLDSASEQPEWWETEAPEAAETPDEQTETDDPSDKAESEDQDPEYENVEIKECADGFDPTAPCEGDWTTTMCLYDEMIWWCENGVWLNKSEDV